MSWIESDWLSKMPKHLLMITKKPEFDERGEVVLGQCEPFTSGWDLLLVNPDRTREILLSGTYTDLHKILECCHALHTELDIRKRVGELRTLQNSSVTETVAVALGSRDAHADSTAVLEPTVTSEFPALPDDMAESTGDGFFELTKRNKVLIALVVSPDRASEVSELKVRLLGLLNRKPKAIVLDLARIGNLASRAANELLIFRDQCAEKGVAFGLCNLRQEVCRLFKTLDVRNPPPLFGNVEEACKAIMAQNQQG